MDTPAVISNSSDLRFPMKCRNTRSRCLSLLQELFHIHQLHGKTGCTRNISIPRAPEDASRRQTEAPGSTGLTCHHPAVSEEQCNRPSDGSRVSLSSHAPTFHPVPPRTSYQHVHQPMAYVNHTNLETDLAKSAQSSSMGTHKIALQTAKINLE